MNRTNVTNIMMRLKTILTACFFLFFLTTSYSQTSVTNFKVLASNDLTEKSVDAEEWTFYYDDENKTYYIDFEAISINLTKIKVINKAGSSVISDGVADLPVNTIYELDCSTLKKGEYTVELHSYTEVMKKKVTLK